MHLPLQTVQWIALGGAVVAVLAFAAGLTAALRLRQLRRAYAAVQDAAEGGDLLGQLAAQREELALLRRRVEDVDGGLAAARADLTDAVRHVAVVRYDAFSDMGGRMSFSAALLDDAGDGLVLTSINGRSETRSYAKGVKAAESDSSLSPEEQQAISFALRATPLSADRGRSRPQPAA